MQGGGGGVGGDEGWREGTWLLAHCLLPRQQGSPVAGGDSAALDGAGGEVSGIVAKGPGLVAALADARRGLERL